MVAAASLDLCSRVCRGRGDLCNEQIRMVELNDVGYLMMNGYHEMCSQRGYTWFVCSMSVHIYAMLGTGKDYKWADRLHYDET